MRILFLSFDYLTRPLGIGYLSAQLVRRGHDTELAAIRDIERQNILLRNFKPEILCLSLITGQHPLFFKRAMEIKKENPGLIILAGGPHPTFYPECIAEPFLDAVCRGEGDNALPDMIDAIAAGGSLPERLPNWWIKRADGTISKTEPSALIENLDSLPFPDAAIYERACRGYSPVTYYIMASRGCPYNCSYCFNHAYRNLYEGNGKICRRRSVENIIAELVPVKQKGTVQIIVFQDDTFNLDRNWLRKFCEKYPREIGLPFHCHLRADLLDEETAALLKNAGCLSVKLGLESGRDYVRNGILKRGMTLEQFENACGFLHKNRIRFATENILAIPGSSLDDDLFTFSINRSVRPQHSFATLMQLYPRTDIAEYAVNNGFLDTPPTEFPATFYDDSSVLLQHKKERGRLRALFALAVSFRFPLPLIRFLIRLPLRRLYEVIDRFWKGYCLRFRIYPYRQTFRGFVKELMRYLRDSYY